jgi:alpha-1,2-mannosyltransferase
MSGVAAGIPRLPVACFVVAVVGVSLAHAIGPGWHEFIDLEVYRDAALGVLHGDSLYDRGFGRIGLPFTYPPFAALVFTPLTVLPPTLAGVVMFALSVLAMLDACVSLQRWGATEGWRPVPALLVAALALGLEPSGSSLDFGQVNLVLFALLLRDASGRTPLPQGVLTGLCAGFKLTPAAFALYYLVTGRWKALRNAVVAGAATVAVAAVFLPGDSSTFWLHATFADPARPGALWYLTNQSMAGSLTRVLPPETGALVATVLTLPLVVLAGLLARRASREGRDLLAFAAVVLVPLLVSPISWGHHWVTVVVPLAALVLAPWRISARARIALFGVLVLVFASRVMTTTLPLGDDSELGFGPAQDLLAASYTLAALAFLAFLTAELYLHRDRPLLPLGGHRGTDEPAPPTPGGSGVRAAGPVETGV